MKKNINYFIIGSFLLFVLLTVLVLTCDVQKYVVTDSNLGLYSFNQLFRVDGNKNWDYISDYLLYTSLFLVAILAFNGLYQLIKFKKFSLIDTKIIAFGVIIVLMIIVWVLFDKIIIINHRPLKIDGELEGSYPSTHVMVVTFIYLGVISFLSMKNKNKAFKIAVYSSIILAILLVSVSRILSEMHWFTDVIGGIILGLFFYFVYLKIVYIIESKKNVSK